MKTNIILLTAVCIIGFVLTSNAQPVVTINDDNITTCNQSVPWGYLTASANSGQAPYTYQWFDASWTQIDADSIYDVSTYATYHAVVTDNNSDKDTATIVVSWSNFSITATPVQQFGANHVSCDGSDGEISVSITGGTAPYLVAVTPGSFGLPDVVPVPPSYGTVYYQFTSQTSVTITGLAAGEYTVTVVSDSGATGCHANGTVTLNEPVMLARFSGTEYDNGYYVSCDTCTDGTFTLSADSSYGTLTYIWVELPPQYEPDYFPGGASPGLPFEYKDGYEPDGLDPGWILSAGSNPTYDDLEAGQWYAGVVMDAATGCLDFKPLYLEVPDDIRYWTLNGNSGTDNWMGTGDSTDLVIKTDSLERIRVQADGKVIITGTLEADNIEVGDGQSKFDTLKVGRILPLEGDTVVSIGEGSINYSTSWNILYPTSTQGGLVKGMGFGTAAIGYGQNSTAIGYRVMTSPTHAPYSVIIGRGRNDANPFVFFENDKPNSLMVGFNTDVASFYVGPANGTSGSYGNVGIATDNPAERLQINGNARIGDNTNYLTLGYDGSDGIIDWAGSTTLKINPTSQNNIQILSNKVTIGNLYNGTTHTDYRLGVNGKVLAREIFVTVDDWADFVFDDNYQLPSIYEVENYININKHLPDVPSENEILANGNNLGEMDAILLQKVEELTLYIIRLNKELEKVKADNEAMKLQLQGLDKK